MLAEGYEGGQGHISPKTDVIEKDVNIDFDWQSPNAVEMTDKIYFNIPRGIDFSAIRYINGMLQNDNHSERVLVASNFVWYYHIQIPKGYRLLSLPKERIVKNKYGSYSVNYSEDGNEIIVKRNLVISQDVYSVYPQ